MARAPRLSSVLNWMTGATTTDRRPMPLLAEKMGSEVEGGNGYWELQGRVIDTARPLWGRSGEEGRGDYPTLDEALSALERAVTLVRDTRRHRVAASDRVLNVAEALRNLRINSLSANIEELEAIAAQLEIDEPGAKLNSLVEKSLLALGGIFECGRIER